MNNPLEQYGIPAEYADAAQKIARDAIMQMMKNEKATKVERFRRLNKFAKKGQILFVGSSLMEQFPVGELLMSMGHPLTIYNRGVGGFTTDELIPVMDACCYELEPKHIFINIGTNDLSNPAYTKEKLIANYETILDGIKEHLPNAKVHVMAYYPGNPEYGMKQNSYMAMAGVFKIRTNERIAEANEAVREMAERRGLDYYDFGDGLKDENGSLKVEYTVEGMHFYGDGYMTVLERMLPVLDALEEKD